MAGVVGANRMRLNCYSDRVPVLIIAYAVLRTPRVVTELARPVKDRRRMCVGRAGQIGSGC